ncbi:putative signal transduction protein [Shewanella baltica OS223]|uniref:HDOD domain-containing protein n=1 Tax=Shewanella baltica TaxID=62322 RepID=UPI0001530E1E|nr:HDOD domain-containing protein [Shewanella baltica]ACK48177.1 putative signal transduction protein [Shewanella baltica OS223]
MAISVAGGVRPGKIIEIEHRLYQQLILGKHKASPTLLDDLDLELEADANKLDVEREAILARLMKQIKAKEVFEAVSSQLHETVNNAIEHQLASPELVLAKSEINESQILLLELLLAKNLDATRLRPLISNLSWLCRDLTNMVNSPSFRARRPQSSDVRVTDIKLVMNYIGIENLRTIIPYFCLRNWLPSANAKLLWTTRKLWRYSIVSGIAANALAQLHNTDSALVYSSALLNQLGTSVVLSLSARLFDQTWGAWIREASSSRDKEVYDAVIATEFPAKAVFEQVLSHGHKLNWQLLELLKFEASPLTGLLKELDLTLSYRELSPQSALVARANCYAKVVLLEEMRQIDPQEKRLMFDYYELTEQEVLRLKAQNYRKLDLL